MSTLPPPAYSESGTTSLDIPTLLSKKSLDGYEQLELYKALSAAYTSPTAQSALSQRIDTITETIGSIKRSFGVVNDELEKLERTSAGSYFRRNEKYRSLCEDWSSYSKKFDSLVIRSRCVAAKGNAVVDDFSREFARFLLDRSIPLPRKKKEMATLKALLESSDNDAEEVASEFEQLNRNLDGFVQRWERMVQSIMSEAQAEIKELKEQIEWIDSELAKTKKKAKKLNKWLYGVAAATALTGVGLLLAPVAIGAGAAIAGGAVAGGAIGGLAGAVHATKEDRDRLSDLLTTRSRDLEEVVTTSRNARTILDAALTRSKPEIGNVVEGVGLLVGVWGMIVADIAVLEQKIDNLQNTATEQLFYARLRSTVPLYVMLGQALRKYARAMKDEEWDS